MLGLDITELDRTAVRKMGVGFVRLLLVRFVILAILVVILLH